MKTINTYYDNHIGLEKFIKSNRDILLNSHNRAVLVQVFSGICEQDFLLAIAKQIREQIPQAQVIGTTTSGEIMNGLVSGLKTVLSFSVFHHSTIESILMEKGVKNDFELGKSIASTLNNEKARVLILFATGLNLNASQLLNGIQSINADLPVAGGNAGDNRTNTRRFVCCNEKASDCGAAGVVINSDILTATCHSHLGWQPIGKEMTITKSEGSRVYTIDHLPACQIYHQYLGLSTKSNIFKVVEFPLIICRPDINIARAPFLRYDDDSIGFFGDFAEGEKVRLGFGHVKMILERIDKLLEKINQAAVESIFVYSCASRRGFLQEAAQIETLPLQSIAPTAGFFTSGEFFHTGSGNQLLNTTMTTLALSESLDKNRDRMPKADAGNSAKEIADEIAPCKDNVADRSIEILRALTCLVDTVTNELNHKTAELELVNEQIKYTGSHDELTGLYNRSFFNQEMERLQGKPAGIIMCDVDGLKLVNDSFGHSKGDTLLQAAAGILRSLFAPEAVVARFGGDEFSILLPDTSRTITEEYCAKIRNAVEKYNFEKPAFPLSISLGYAWHDSGTDDMSSLLKEADNEMYWEKLYHRQKTDSDMARTLMRTMEEKDITTEEHSRRLQDLFITLSLDREFPQCSLSDFFIFTRFHDIGKVGISAEILSKTEPLTPEEIMELHKHCEIGFRIARSLKEFRPIADWILKHHEWWNGQGYPLGIKGDDIPLECRILAILDAYDEMTSGRPYRQSMNPQDALAEIRRCAGTQFDPVLAVIFICKMENVCLKD